MPQVAQSQAVIGDLVEQRSEPVRISGPPPPGPDADNARGY
jgi:hypothetical protein